MDGCELHNAETLPSRITFHYRLSHLDRKQAGRTCHAMVAAQPGPNVKPPVPSINRRRKTEG